MHGKHTWCGTPLFIVERRIHLYNWQEHRYFKLGTLEEAWLYSLSVSNCIFFSVYRLIKEEDYLSWISFGDYIKIRWIRKYSNTDSAITFQLPVQIKRVCEFKKGSSNKNKGSIFSQTQTECHFFIFYIFIYLCSRPYCITIRIIIEENFLLLRTEKDSKTNLWSIPSYCEGITKASNKSLSKGKWAKETRTHG